MTPRVISDLDDGHRGKQPGLFLLCIELLVGVLVGGTASQRRGHSNWDLGDDKESV